MKKSFFLGLLRIDDLSLSEILTYLNQRFLKKQFTHIITVNATFFLELHENPQLKNILSQDTLCVPESIGLSWLCRVKKNRSIFRLPGIDLMQILCAQAAEKKQKVYFLGAKPGVAQAAAENLKKRFPSLIVAGTHHGYFSLAETPQILKAIQESETTLLFVALMMPQQEEWIARYAQELPGICAMGVGGSFDVLSETLKRAPLMMQKMGLEWLFRLWQEPLRFGRIFRLLKIFFIQV